jgi:hypothetical protein
MVKLVSFLYASSALGDKAFLFPRGQRIAAYTESSGILTKVKAIYFCEFKILR